MLTTQELIGKILTEDAERDAVHLAVLPVVAVQKLDPGQHVGLVAHGKAAKTSKPIGIVDPFLKGQVFAGQKFFLFLYPNTITSLRHVWTHPEISDKSQSKAEKTLDAIERIDGLMIDKAASEAWLRKYASRVNSYLDAEKAYTTLMRDLETGELTYHGTDMHSRSELIDGEELRRHAEVVLGKPINYDDFEYFSCSC